MRTGCPHPGTVQDPESEGTGTLTALGRSLDSSRIRTIIYYISYSSTCTLENFGWTPPLGVRQISNIISLHSIDACTCYTHNYLTIIVPLRSSALSLSSHAIMSSFTATTGVVHLPTFQLLREDFVQALAGAARATSASTDDIGDYFNMAMASKLSIDQTPDDATVLVPLFNIEDGAIANASILASGPTMYARLLGHPQPRMVFAKCIAYSAGVECQPFPIGTLIKFPPPTHLWVAKESLVNAIDNLGPKVFTDPNIESSRPPKRACRRPLEEEGELADFTRLGMSKFMMNLDGDSFSMRDKTDIGAREKKLFLLFRMLEKNRWEYAMGPDYKLQTEEYRNTIIQQGRTRAEHKNKAFLTCSFLDRIQGLKLVQNSDRLELLLTGAVFVEGGLPTLELSDFVTANSSEQLSTGNTVCPFQNRPLVAVLKNFQDALHVFFSHQFKSCLQAGTAKKRNFF